MFKHLLVATDGSELGNKALDAALTIAKAHGYKLTVLTSTDPISTGLGAGGMGTIDTGTIWASLEEAHAEQARNVLDAARQKAAAADVEINAIHLPQQHPAEGIIRAVEELGSDTIVMGSHGRRGLERVILGSQANEVLTRSKVPVLVIK